MKTQNERLIDYALEYLDSTKSELGYKIGQVSSLKEEKLTLESQVCNLKEEICNLEGKLTLEEEKNHSLTNQINESKSISPTVLAQGGIVELNDGDLKNLHKTLEVQLAHKKNMIRKLKDNLTETFNKSRKLEDENLRLTKLVEMYENQEN